MKQVSMVLATPLAASKYDAIAFALSPGGTSTAWVLACDLPVALLRSASFLDRYSESKTTIFTQVRLRNGLSNSTLSREISHVRASEACDL